MTFFAPTAFDVNWRDRKCGRRDDMCIREGIDARATFFVPQPPFGTVLRSASSETGVIQKHVQLNLPDHSF
jgi:hypothetical protein